MDVRHAMAMALCCALVTLGSARSVNQVSDRVRRGGGTVPTVTMPPTLNVTSTLELLTTSPSFGLSCDSITTLADVCMIIYALPDLCPLSLTLMDLGVPAEPLHDVCHYVIDLQMACLPITDLAHMCTAYGTSTAGYESGEDMSSGGSDDMSSGDDMDGSGSGY